MKTHILCPVTFFRKSHRLWDNVEKYSEDPGVTNDVTIWRIRVACWISKAICTYAHAHAHAPEYPHARKHAQACTHRPTFNTYCFSTATIVSWTRLNVTLYVHCLCWILIEQWVAWSSDQHALVNIMYIIFLWYSRRRPECRGLGRHAQGPQVKPHALLWRTA
jgi:hypothetical protein